VAHYRKPLAAAVALNTAIFLPEVMGGAQAGSLSLIMDGVHNFSDELALVFLYLAFVLPQGVTRNLVRSANFFSAVGLIGVSGLLIWQAIDRLLHPAPVLGLIPIAMGLAAAGANWGIVCLLRGPSRDNAAIRLAYLHNIGDIFVSLAPVLAGLLVAILGRSYFDAWVALLVAFWFVASTLRAIIGAGGELIWPGKITCGHPDGERPAASSAG
jgi:cobalt-zinc-cadmium efflux system protein